MKKLCWLLAVLLLLLQEVAWADGKTVHVKAYTRKDGTHVAAHTRSAPGSKSSSGSFFVPIPSVVSEPRTTVRTQARVEPRTSYRSTATYSVDGDLEALDKQTEATFGRLWTDISGDFTLRAEFVGYFENKATLRKFDHKEISIPSVNLSKADQEWIRAELRRRKEALPKPAVRR